MKTMMTILLRIFPATWARPSLTAQSVFRQSVARGRDHADLDDAKVRLSDLERRVPAAPPLKFVNHGR